MHEFEVLVILSVDPKLETKLLTIKARTYSYIVQEGIYYFIDDNGERLASVPGMRVGYVKIIK